MAFCLLSAAALPAAALAAPIITSAPTDPTGDNTPTFGGDGAVAGSDVTVVLKPVSDGLGTGVDPPDLIVMPAATGAWSAGVVAPGLADGTYVATAQQGLDSSAPLQFRVDTTPPALTVTRPAAVTSDTTPTLGGAAGIAPGDASAVTLELRAGSDGTGALVLSQPASVVSASAEWTVVAPQLEPGPYSVRAVQQDSLAHTTTTPWRNFTVKPPPPPPPPPAPAGPLSSAEPARPFVLAAAPAPTPAAGPPAAAPRTGAALLRPFPVVQISGQVGRFGTRVHRLWVTAPRAARIRARCAGPGCPARLRAYRRRAAGRMEIRPLAGRVLRPRAVIEIIVSAPGAIGKYTRLEMRQGKPPRRTDRCVAVDGRTVLSCARV